MLLTEEQVCEGGEWLEDPNSFLKLAFLQKKPVVNSSDIMFAVGRRGAYWGRIGGGPAADWRRTSGGLAAD